MTVFKALTLLSAFVMLGCSTSNDDDLLPRESGDDTESRDASVDGGTSEERETSDSEQIDTATATESPSKEQSLESLSGQIKEEAILAGCANDDDCVLVWYGCSFVVYTPRVTNKEKLTELIAEYDALYWQDKEEERCPPSGVFNYRCIDSECKDVGSDW